MKIDVVFNQTKSYNGIKKYYTSLIEGLNAKGNSVNPIALKKYEIMVRGKLYGGWQSENFFKHFVKTSGTIVHCSSDRSYIKQANVITIHDIYNYNTNINERAYFRDIFRKIQDMQVIVPSKTVKDTIEKYANNIHVVTTGIKIPNLQFYNPYPADGKMHLITMGEIHKNFHKKKLIHILYEWLKDNPNIDLYHIGNITDEKYINYAKNIHNLQNVSEGTKFAYLKYADKYVYNTEDEGQGIPTMEAMRIGTQPVLNDLPVHRELLGDKPYYYHNKEEFMDLLHKPRKEGLVEQIMQYDNWIDKTMSVYNEVD